MKLVTVQDGHDMLRSRLVLITVAGVLVAGLGAWVWILRHPSTAATRSLAQISVDKFHRVGEYNDTRDDMSYDSAVYIGPGLPDGKLATMIHGPGVRIRIYSGPSRHSIVLPHDSTISIGEGSAPSGCYLSVYKYIPGRGPEFWWGINQPQLKLADEKNEKIIVLTTMCGRG